jgi:CHASE3 domain sensor protein
LRFAYGGPLSNAAVSALNAQPDLRRTRAFDAAVAHLSRSRGAGWLRGLRGTPGRLWDFLRRLLTGRDIPRNWRDMIIGLTAILLAVCAVIVILIVRSVHG